MQLPVCRAIRSPCGARQAGTYLPTSLALPHDFILIRAEPLLAAIEFNQSVTHLDLSCNNLGAPSQRRRDECMSEGARVAERVDLRLALLAGGDGVFQARTKGLSRGIPPDLPGFVGPACVGSQASQFSSVGRAELAPGYR